MKASRIVLDTNVTLSAIIAGGNPAEYFSLAIRGRIELFISPFLVEELTKVLKKKFKQPKDKIEKIVHWYQSLSTLVYPTSSIHKIKRKISDNHLLECAVGAQADLLVTGDKRDLLPLKKYQGILIVSPIEGLAMLTETQH